MIWNANMSVYVYVFISHINTYECAYAYALMSHSNTYVIISHINKRVSISHIHISTYVTCAANMCAYVMKPTYSHTNKHVCICDHINM